MAFGLDDIAGLASIGSSVGGLFGGRRSGFDAHAAAVNAAAVKATDDISADIQKYEANESSLADSLVSRGYSVGEVTEILQDQRKALALRAWAEARRQRASAWGANAFMTLEQAAARLSHDSESDWWRGNSGSGAFGVQVDPLPDILLQAQTDITNASAGTSAGGAVATPVAFFPSRPLIVPPLPGRRAVPGTQLPSGPDTLNALRNKADKIKEALMPSATTLIAGAVIVTLIIVIAVRR